jgi:Cytochrome c biogenesis protein
MIPAYISYLTGASIKELQAERPKLMTVYKAIGFIIGFSFIFILMGVSVTTLGKAFISHREIVRKVGGLLVVLFGIHTMGIIKLGLLYREKRLLKMERFQGSFSSVFLGMAFAAGWTPCIGPILSSILILATNEASIGKGILLLIMYSLGMAVPFLCTAIAIGNIGNHLKKVTKYFPVISFISGALLIVMGALIFSNKLAILSQYFSVLKL